MSANQTDTSDVFIKAYLIRTSIMHAVLEILGDPWNLSLVRELSLGAKKFVFLADALKISRAALSTRLNRLEQQGCISTRQYCDAPPRSEYLLTPMGEALRPTLLLLEQWNQQWLSDHPYQSKPTKCVQCKTPLKLLVACRHCSLEMSLKQVKPLFYQPLPAHTPTLHGYRRTRHNLAAKDSPVDAQNISAEQWLRDRWSSLIIGSMLYGLHRFNDMQSILDIAPNILSGRLELLLQANMISRHNEGYRLLPRGSALYPAIIAMSDWGRQWLADAALCEHGWRMLHVPCSNWAEHAYICQHCQHEYP